MAGAASAMKMVRLDVWGAKGMSIVPSAGMKDMVLGRGRRGGIGLLSSGGMRGLLRSPVHYMVDGASYV